MNKELIIFPFEDSLDRPNIIYIQGDNKTLMIDAGGGPKTYKYILKELEKNKLKLPDYILLTHYHWDHCFGVGYFNSKIISSKFTNEKLKEMMDLKINRIEDFISDDKQPLFCLEHLKLEYDDISLLKLKEADILFNKDLHLDLGNRIVDIYETISPHTKGSLIAYDKNSKTLIIGDALYGEIHGYDFITNQDKYYSFTNFVNTFDYEYIIDGHSSEMSKEEFFKRNKIKKDHKCGQFYHK